MSKIETPKTETTETKRPEGNPKAETKPNPFAAFDPMAYWAQSQQLWTNAMSDAQARMTAFTSQFSALDPNPYWTSFRDAMLNATAKASSTAEGAAAQYASLEAQLVERAQAAVGTWAQLAHDAIGYGAQLSAEARKLGADAARKMGAQA